MLGKCLECSGGIWEVFECVLISFGFVSDWFSPVFGSFGELCGTGVAGSVPDLYI